MSEQPASRSALREELSGQPPPAPPEPPVVVAPPPEVKTLRHHDTCPGIRGKECTCAANLGLIRGGEYKPLEQKFCTWSEPTKLVGDDGQVKSGLRAMKAELWRVDDGRIETVIKANPTSSTAKPIRVEMQLDPRWVCTRCGWAGRGKDISHRCDVAAVQLATKVATLADGLSDEERFSGNLRVAFWRDVDGVYHVIEELIRDGKVVKMAERDRDGAYGVVEGALLSAAVDLWS